MVRQHHAASHTAALLEGAGADRVKVGCFGIHYAYTRQLRRISQMNSTSYLSAVEACQCLNSASSLCSTIGVRPFDLFRLLLPDCGTSRRRRLCLF